LRKFNPKKCYVMRIITRARNFTVRKYYLNGEELQRIRDFFVDALYKSTFTYVYLHEVYCSSYLGIQLQSDLRWNAQVEYAAGKASRTLGMLKRNLRVNSVKLKTTAYTSLVRPMTIVQQHGTHTPIKTSQSWKPSNAVLQDI